MPAAWPTFNLHSLEFRHSFVSVLSSSGLSIENSHPVGHASTRVTELIYLKELRPVLTRAARVMDNLFDGPTTENLGSQVVLLAWLQSPVSP